MNQGRYGGRTLHGVRQPDMEREHGALARSADEHKSEGQRDHCPGGGQQLCVGREGECPGIIAVEEDADEEAQIGEAGDDEGFLRCRDRFGLGVVEADQQVGAHAHQLPKQIHLEDVGGDHQSQHTHREERQEGVVTLETPFALHVAQRVDMHHQRDGRDHHEHHHRDRIEQDAHIDMQRLADREPNGVVGHQRRENALRVTPGAEIENGREVAQHGDRTQHDRTDGARRSRFEFGAGQSEYQETQQRQYEN